MDLARKNVRRKILNYCLVLLVAVLLIGVIGFSLNRQSYGSSPVQVSVKLNSMLHDRLSSRAVIFKKTITTSIATTAVPPVITSTTTATITPDQCGQNVSKSITNTAPGSHNSIDVDVSCQTTGTGTDGTTSISVTTNNHQTASSGDVSDGGTSGNVSISDNSSVTINKQ